MTPFADLSDPHFWPSAQIGLLLILLFGIPAVWKPTLGQSFFGRAERFLSRLGERKPLAVCAMFFGVVAIRLVVLPLLPVPVPGIHDEFSYLLMSDTFAHGRLANPPHPMWMSFETFHVNWFPTYSSMYPPAQGFVLAIGQLLGHPWIGVLLSDAAMCAAVLWMLQAWMPARWAFLGGVFCALNLGIASYWMNSYWGGAVAAVGGALLFGALGRIRKRATILQALLLAFGAAILANSRPYEGFLVCIPPGIWLLAWLLGKIRSRLSVSSRIRIVLVPLCIVLVFTLTFVGYYNWRLTGNALLLPHVLNTRTYDPAPLFLWQHAKPEMTYNNQQFEDFFNGWEREEYQNTWRGVFNVTSEKIARMGAELLWPGAIFLLPGFLFALRGGKMRLLAATLALCFAGVSVVVWSAPHYAAPITCILYALLAQSVRHLRVVKWKSHPFGVSLSRAALVVLLAGTGVSVARRVCDPIWWTCAGDPSRVYVQNQLMQMPGKHLLIVRYSDDHNVHDEWVYNGADIDGSKVVWARELAPEQNAKLFAYFKNRDVWLVEPDVDNTEIKRYTPLPDSGQ